jgi:hypothetical protein
MSRAVGVFIEELMRRAASEPELPDWRPELRGTCECGHSWIYHWLRAPHGCNEKREDGTACECPGYACAEVFEPRRGGDA